MFISTGRLQVFETFGGGYAKRRGIGDIWQKSRCASDISRRSGPKAYIPTQVSVSVVAY